MTPDETVVLRSETDDQTNNWYDALFAVAMPARALRLGRPMLKDECFFECAWDVTLVKCPKLTKAPVRVDKLDDLCAKAPTLCGERRLYFYPQAIVVCQRGIEPAASEIPKSCIPPFKVNDFIEFQVLLALLMCVANFGKQGKYFFMQMGRQAPTGSGEIWAMAESGEVATDIHNQLNKILEWESEKSRQLGIGQATNALKRGSMIHPHVPSSGRLGAAGTGHRERSHTQPQRQCSPSFDNSGRLGSPGGGVVGSFPAQRKTSEQPSSYHTPPFGSSPLGWTPTSSTRSNNISGQSGSAACAAAKQKQMDMHQMKSPPIEKETLSEYTTMRSEDSEDSGGTLRLDPVEPMTLLSRQMGEEYMRMGSDEPLSDVVYPMGDYTEMGVSMPGEVPTSCWIVGDTDYMPMDAGTPPIASSSSGSSAPHLAEPSYQQMNWNLEEVRSYVLDSSDSCYSSMAVLSGGSSQGTTVAPRAYSFGSRGSRCTGGVQVLSVHGHSGDVSPVLRSGTSSAVVHQPSDDLIRATTALAPDEAARKRAYSLGSKSWFRKFSNMSLGRYVDPSSCVSSESRTRSNSFGSGRSTPFGRKETGGRSSISVSNHDKDLVELDFGDGGGGAGGLLGRSPSGSLASSCESPSRSRTSSFGAPGGRHADTDHHGQTPIRALTSPSEKPSDKLIAALLQHTTTLHEEVTPPSNLDSSDYVLQQEESALNYAFLQLTPSSSRVTADAGRRSTSSVNNCDYAHVNPSSSSEEQGIH